MNDKIETPLGELVELFDHLMLGDERWSQELNKFVPSKNGSAKGFSIGKGKQLHWYIEPSSRTGKYRCHQHYGGGQEIGRGRYCYPETKVTVHYGI